MWKNPNVFVLPLSVFNVEIVFTMILDSNLVHIDRLIDTLVFRRVMLRVSALSRGLFNHA